LPAISSSARDRRAGFPADDKYRPEGVQRLDALLDALSAAAIPGRK
jgi:hypothetical protein